MKKSLIWILAVMLLVSVFSFGNAEAESETGPVELNQVVYEDHGLRVTALSYEDHRQEPGYDAQRAQSAFDLILRIEKTEEGVSFGIRDISVNGWGGDAVYVDREYMYQIGLDPAANPDLRVYALQVLPRFVSDMEITSIGRVNGVISWRKGEEFSGFDLFSVDLGCPCEPECPVTVSEFAMYRADGLVYVNNPTDWPVVITYLLTAKDADGTPLGTIDMARGTFAPGAFRTITVRPHAEQLPVAIIQPGSMQWMTADNQWADGELSYTFVPLHAQKDQLTQDISDQLSATVEGRADWNDYYVTVRYTWPEDIDRVLYSATMLRYVGDEVVDATGVSANNLDRNEQDRENDMRDLGHFYLYASEKDKQGERFEIFVTTARIDK